MFGWIEFDDLVSASLQAVVRANESFDPEKNANRLGYIYTIGYFRAIDILRAEHSASRRDKIPAWKRREVKVVAEASLPCSDDGEPLQLELLRGAGVPQEQYLKTSCREWLRGLRAREREILILHFDEGLTFIEIGKRLGTSAAGVYICARRAVERLRVTRKKEFESGERSLSVMSYR